MGWIYKITSPIGRIYVGQTRDLKRRIGDYRFKKKKYETIVFNSIKKYGWDSHVMEILEEIEDEKLSEREIYWIKKCNSYFMYNKMGMNMTTGGEGHRGTWMYDEERRRKQSERFSKEGNPFYGKNHTEETRKKFSEIAKIRNKREGRRVPEYGVIKGIEKVIIPVACYDVNGDLIAIYKSMQIAANMLKVNRSCISESVKYNSYVYGKYTFRAVKNQIGVFQKIQKPEKIEVKNEKRPIVCFYNTYSIRYESAEIASKDLGIPKTTINRAALYNKLRPIRKGHIFIYEDLLKNYNLAV